MWSRLVNNVPIITHVRLLFLIYRAISVANKSSLKRNSRAAEMTHRVPMYEIIMALDKCPRA